MKKLLSFLSALTLIGTSNLAVISCDMLENKDDSQKQDLADVIPNTRIGSSVYPSDFDILLATKEHNPEINIDEVKVSDSLMNNDFIFTATIVPKPKSKIYKGARIVYLMDLDIYDLY